MAAPHSQSRTSCGSVLSSLEYRTSNAALLLRICWVFPRSLALFLDKYVLDHIQHRLHSQFAVVGGVSSGPPRFIRPRYVFCVDILP